MSSSPLDCWLTKRSARKARRARKPATAKTRPLVERLEARDVPTTFFPSDIGGRVWVDCDLDGVFDSNETPIAGVTITLTGTLSHNGGSQISQTVVTGADGSYLFTNLQPGRYTITETQPNEYLDGKDYLGTVTIGSSGAPTGSNGIAENDRFVDIVLDGGDNHGRNYNFTEYERNSLGGTVFLDLNDNGTQDQGEPGIAGAKLVLTGIDDLGQQVNQTVFTAGDGTYSFNDLRPGAYTITETTPDGYLDGKDAIGTVGGKQSGTFDGNDRIVNITIDGCHSGVGYNFGERKDQPLTNSISGKVWVDCDQDGVFDPEDHVLAGVTVTIDGILSDTQTYPPAIYVTGADGRYEFTNLPAGVYFIREVLDEEALGLIDGKERIGTPFSATVGDDEFTQIVIPAGKAQHGVNYDFTEIEPSKLAGTVFHDVNGDGIQNNGEVGIPGVQVVLTGTNDLGKSVSVTVTTGAQGQYEFGNLRPGQYAITEVQPDGWTTTKNAAGTVNGIVRGNVTGDVIANIDLSGCESGINFNFGEKKVEVAKSSISGYVYVDCDNDGVFDGDEHALAGVTVTLAGNGVTLTTTTDANGFYQFENLDAGVYTITEVLDEASKGLLDGKDTLGTPYAGTVTDDQMVVTITAAGTSGQNYNFGELEPSQLSGKVFEDANSNGVQDTDEPGIAGVTLFLQGTDDRGASVFTSTTTKADGTYSFMQLRPGQYQIIEVQPMDYLSTINKAGTINGKVSGVVVGDVITKIELGSCESGVGINYDFGEKKCPPEEVLHQISGFVYEDCDNDGIFDPTDEPIANAVVILTGTDITGASVSIRTATDDKGFYQFQNLRAGNYTLTEVQPDNYLDGKDAAGTPFGGTASAKIGEDVISNIVIPVSETSKTGENYNFGEVASSISGVIYEDNNDNGVRDPGENLITVPVTVTLTGTDDTGASVTRSIVTTTGEYKFDMLRPGVYKLNESQPVGYDDGKDRAGDPTNGTVQEPDSIVNIVLDGCTHGKGYDFGERKSEVGGAAVISGTVFVDCDNDGILDADEADRIAGVTIILTGTTTTGKAVNLTTTTNLDGDYIFTDLEPGTYQLTEVQPAIYLDGRDSAGTPFGGTAAAGVGQDTISNIVIPENGGTGVNYNFGELEGKLSGFVYQDMNDNGIFDPGEMPISGVTITLTGVNDLNQSVTVTTTTNASGKYEFNNLRPGQYSLAETQPPNFLQGKNTLGTIRGATSGKLEGVDTMTSITVDGCTDGINFNFGECPPASISGYVYFDTGTGGKGTAGYNDGIRQEFETQIAGVTITLTGTTNTGQAVTLTTTTGIVPGQGQGYYEFKNLAPGTYIITETQPGPINGQVVLDGKDTPGTPLGSVSTVNDQISNIVLECGVDGQNNNFGELREAGQGAGVANIRGMVYIDLDCDGIQDANETQGIAGVTIQLLAADGTVLRQTTTNAQGRYEFLNVPAGTYSIREIQPGGFVDSGEHVGTLWGGTLSNDLISNLVVVPPEDGELTGENYNFGECLGGKRRFLASSQTTNHGGANNGGGDDDIDPTP